MTVSDAQDLEGGPLPKPPRTGRKPLTTRNVLKRVSRSSLLNALLPFVIFLGAWEITARAHVFPEVLFPSWGSIGGKILGMLIDLSLFNHIGGTLYRMSVGFAIAIVVGTLIGFLMGRILFVERFFAPLFTVLLPVPALAWQPLFILWFGIGDKPTIILVAFASSLPVAMNTWTGVRTMQSVWFRAAASMNVRGFKLLTKVTIPGSLPMTLTGLRLGIAQAWRAVIAGELIAATNFGLGVLIFTSQQFLNTAVMLGSIAVIAGLGLVVERFTFGILEKRTAMRWGMVTDLQEQEEE